MVDKKRNARSEVMIKALELTKRYDQVTALDSVSFEIKRGEIVGFLGPNGAGKSTTMKILTGYLAPTKGTASIAGRQIDALDEGFQRQIGYLPEHGTLYPEMTPRAFLRFVCRVRGIQRKAMEGALARVVSMCGLGDVMNRPIGTLSKGYRQRVGIAQATIHEPDVLILDEPTSGLDPNQVEDIRRLIRDFGSDRTVLFSSHILGEVQAVSNRILILNNGCLVADDKPEALMDRVSGSTVLVTVAGPNPAELLQWAEDTACVERVEDLLDADSELSIRLYLRDPMDKAEVARSIVGRGWSLLELRVDRADLETVFRTLTGAQA